jgi:hypothetical protein
MPSVASANMPAPWSDQVSIMRKSCTSGASHPSGQPPAETASKL